MSNADSRPFDPLDMGNYRIEKLPKRSQDRLREGAGPGRSAAGRGHLPACWGSSSSCPSWSRSTPPAWSRLRPTKAFTAIARRGVGRSNYLMLAVFAAAIILWMTDALPNYLTIPDRDRHPGALGGPVREGGLCAARTPRDVAQHHVVCPGQHAGHDRAGQAGGPVVPPQLRPDRVLHFFELPRYECGLVRLHLRDYRQGGDPPAHLHGHRGDLRRPGREGQDQFRSDIVLQNFFYINIGAGASSPARARISWPWP